MADHELVIGIDLGTTNSAVATVQGGQPVLIPNRTGQRLTPSVVAVARGGKRLVGQIAKRQAITNPQDTVAAAKRLIGRKFSSPQVQQSLERTSYQVVCGQHDDVRVVLGGSELSLPEISALVLQSLKLDAEAYLGRPVRKAVITVPAHFNDAQRQATKDAGTIAGLEVLRIINEPTAAALAYGFGRSVRGKVAVFDLGGGTFDVSVMEVANDVFEVVATGGDTYLGGEDFDARIIEWLVMGFAKEHGVDLRKDRMALQRLRDAAEKAKVELSGVREAQVSLPFIYTPAGGGSALHLEATLTRDTLEELTRDLAQRTLALVDRVLAEARLRPSQLKEVILVGGQTRMPLIQELVRKHFGREPCKGVHPEEVVALGAAIQAHALASGESEVVLLDVTSLSLGVAVAGGYARRLIPRNTTVPTAVTETFTTSRDNQRQVKIMVLQGESDVAHQNELLGEFTLEGLRPAQRGQVKVDVTFDINSEGLVSVAAVDQETGQRQSITVSASSGLTPDELARILDAQRDFLLEARTGEEVRLKREQLEVLLREAEQLVPQVRRLVGGDHFHGDVLRNAERALAAAREALGRQELGPLTQAFDVLTRTLAVCRGVLAQGGSRAS